MPTPGRWRHADHLFTQRYQAARTPGRAAPPPVIVADPRSNSLLVAAGMDDNQAIDDLLVQKLDRKLEDPSMVVTVLGLQHNDSAPRGRRLWRASSPRA